jgi:hypothetical protein
MRVFLLAAVLAALAAPVAAEPSWAVLQKAGITGRWAEKCGAPASMDNWYSTYYGTADGRAHFTVDRGADAARVVTTVDDAAMLGPQQLRWTLRYDHAGWGQLNGRSFVIVSEILGTRMRTLTSTSASGQVLIKDGKLVANGVSVPYETKCSN